MSSNDRQYARARYEQRCGYCGVSETDVGAELTIDHFQPRSAGGTDTPDNLVYCCNACNQYKGNYWRPDGDQRVLHPLFDPVSTHFVELPSGALKPLTETGAFHIRLLHLNRRPLVAHRREREIVAQALVERQETLTRLDQLEHRIASMQSRIAEIKVDTGDLE